MQVNMLEAKNQLSRLVKAALAGEEVIIASHGQPRVRLVPCSESPGLRHCGALSGGIKEKERSLIEAAFSAEADHAAQQLMEG
ncbi:MAG: type II toxin-antitoxin system prevent-host-death family antitoxin [Cyanobacteria bacterium]|jgi:prevent-host-death family protein|nr:type II toxin-antitoxin system prevent-host-death family antitoxin [Cyanobacteriota bacterium]